MPLPSGFVGIGGYVLASVNNTAYDNDRVLRAYWGGVKWHVTSDFYLVASYYGYHQRSYATGTNAGCSTRANSGCSGGENAAGVLGDFSFGRHIDTYLGTLWTSANDALAIGYLNTSTLTTTLGFRVRFNTSAGVSRKLWAH